MMNISSRNVNPDFRSCALSRAKTVRAILAFVLLVPCGIVMAAAPTQHPGREASDVVIVPEPVHLRSGLEREWDSFPAESQGDALEVVFQLVDPDAWHSLRWQQEDVRRRWSLTLNGRHVSNLLEDEARIAGIVEIPAGLLRAGENVLRVSSESEEPDDVLVGPVRLLSDDPERVLEEVRIAISVRDHAGSPSPARITIVDERRALARVRGPEDARHAVRPGVVYSSDGTAPISLSRGVHTIYASRGPEYEVDSLAVDASPGDELRLDLHLQKSVPTDGYVSIDTHTHTLALSGHGDASLEERLVTLVGEGLGGAVLTEHNVHASLADLADSIGVARDLLLVAGNEFTSPIGHFNVFPVSLQEAAPSADVGSWADVERAIENLSEARIHTLNHGRDIHAGFVPLGGDRFVALSGERLDGEVLPANAMEIWNSSAQLHDPFQLFRDWLGLVNRGHLVTPVAGSDSHDVSRYAVGQGRTYVRCVGCANASGAEDAVMRAMEDGRVLPSMGLLTEIVIEGAPASGDLVAGAAAGEIVVRVWGPSWMPLDYVALYQNGTRIRLAPAQNGRAAGLKGEWRWPLPSQGHDASLVALAWGAAPDAPFWPIPKPYQRTSQAWAPHVAGASGLVRVDHDGDGRWSSPHDYARRLIDARGDDLPALMKSLKDYDASVAVQAASLLRAKGVDAQIPELVEALSAADSAVARAFAAYYATLGP